MCAHLFAQVGNGFLVDTLYDPAAAGFGQKDGQWAVSRAILSFG